MSQLSNILAAKQRTESTPKKQHPALAKVFDTYELAILGAVDFERGDKYNMFYNTPGKEHMQPGASGDGVGLAGTTPTQHAPEGQTIDPTIGSKPGKPPVDQLYLDGLLDDYDRWRKTGSRFVLPVTEQQRRAEHMGKMYTGNMQGFSGARGDPAIRRKNLLGR